MSKTLSVRCGCGGEIVAKVVEGFAVIRVRRHGETHEAVVDLLELALQSRRADGLTVPHAHHVHQAARRPQIQGAETCRKT